MPENTKPVKDDYRYLDSEKMQSGDILLPRMASANAIVSNSESISLLETAISFLNKYPIDLPGIQALSSINTILASLGNSGGNSLDEIRFYLLWMQIKNELSKLATDPKMDLLKLKNSIRELLPASNIEDINQAIFNGYYVGHCAIVERTENELWIIESSHTHGRVRSVLYSEWLAERITAGALIWHGRLNNANGEDICRTAHKYRMLEKRYAIFDSAGIKFNISNNQTVSHTPGNHDYIYCSELIYLCLKENNYPSLKYFYPSKEIPMITPKDITDLKDYKDIQTPCLKLLKKIAPNTPHKSKNDTVPYSHKKELPET
jgi:hypothetical protein